MKDKIQSLFWGILSAGAALFIELIVTSVFKIDYFESIGLIPIIIISLSAIIEESFKYIVIIKSIEPLSFGRGIIMNSWVAGLGFSLVEILFFYQKVSSENLIFNESDLIKIILLHIFTFGIFGYKVAIKESNKLDIGLILIVSIIHILYNLSVQYSEKMAYPMGNLVLLILFLYNISIFITVNKRLADED